MVARESTLEFKTQPTISFLTAASIIADVSGDKDALGHQQDQNVMFVCCDWWISILLDSFCFQGSKVCRHNYKFMAV